MPRSVSHCFWIIDAALGVVGRSSRENNRPVRVWLGWNPPVYTAVQAVDPSANYLESRKVNLATSGGVHTRVYDNLGNIAKCQKEQGAISSCVVSLRRMSGQVNIGVAKGICSFDCFHREMYFSFDMNRTIVATHAFHRDVILSARRARWERFIGLFFFMEITGYICMLI